MESTTDVSKLFTTAETSYEIDGTDYGNFLDGQEMPVSKSRVFVPSGEFVRSGRTLSASGIMRETVDGDETTDAERSATVLAVEPGPVVRALNKVLGRESKVRVYASMITGIQQSQ